MAPGASSTTIETDWELLRSYLPANYRELAEQHRLIRPDLARTLGAKITDIDQALRLLFHHVGTNSSLAVTAAMGAASGIANVSAVALHKWMKKIRSYVCELLEVVGQDPKWSSERWGEYHVRLVDATTVNRPGAKGTTNRVHYVLDLPTLRPRQVQVTDEKVGETLRNFAGQEGDLWLGDRAYANPPGINWMYRAGAHVLLRYNRGSLPLFDRADKPIDVLGILRRLRTKGTRSYEQAVWVYGDDRISGRLIIRRLPRDKAEEAKERARKEHCGRVRKETILAAGFLILFTTVPADRMSAAQLCTLYRLRWQIELSFKRDKSIAGLDRLANFREDTCASWLTIKLLLIQLSRVIARGLTHTENARHAAIESREIFPRAA